MVQMQGGNDVDYPGVISTSCQRGRCAVIGRPAGRRGEDQEMYLFEDNPINSGDSMKYQLKPSRIQDLGNYSVTGRGYGSFPLVSDWLDILSCKRTGSRWIFSPPVVIAAKAGIRQA